MAIDTAAKRSAALLDQVTLFPDGNIGAADRANLIGQYFIGAPPPVDVITGTSLTSDDLLNLRGVRRRVDSYIFELLDNANNVISEVQPSRGSPSSVELDTSRRIMRTMSGFMVDADRQGAIDTESARIRPSLVLQNGDQFPLGVFLFGDGSRPRRSWGLELNASLQDASFILDQPVGRFISYPKGTNSVDAATALGQEVIKTTTISAPSKFVTSAPLAFRPSETRMSIMNALLLPASYYPVYFDNDGAMRIRPVQSLPAENADFEYESGGRIIKDSILETDDLLTAPNRYIVIDTSATSTGISGYCDIPASAPNSYVNRGFYVTKVIEAQGIGSQSLANAAAQAAANSEPSGFKKVTFDSTHEPRHDAFNIIDLLGDQYREVAWKITLRSGSPMGHTLRRVYS